MTNPRSIPVIFALSVLLMSLLVAGCGGSASSSNGASSADGVSLTHIDGTLTVRGGDVTVTRASGAAVQLAVGPAVGKGELQALAASGAKARVFYAEKGAKIAAKVEPVPTASAGAKTIDGVITKASTSSISIQTSDGAAHTFTIRAEDRSAFDTAHLQEHAAEDSPVRIYYRTGADGTHDAVAYEDA